MEIRTLLFEYHAERLCQANLFAADTQSAKRQVFPKLSQLGKRTQAQQDPERFGADSAVVPLKPTEPFRRYGGLFVGQPDDCVYVSPLVARLDCRRADVERPIGRAEHLYHFSRGKAEIHVPPCVIFSPICLLNPNHEDNTGTCSLIRLATQPCAITESRTPPAKNT